MAKRKKTIIAGNLVKTVIYTAPEPRDAPRMRAEKSRATTAAQKAMNDKTARARLEMLLAANFQAKDLFVTLTYRAENLPADRAAAVANVRKWLKALRDYRKAREIPFKYVYVTESKHGAGRVHHHIIMNATERDIEVIRSLWAWGDIIDIEYVGGRSYAALAQYITKEAAAARPVGAQMWTGSRNLEKPTVTVCYVDNDAALTVPLGCHVLEKEERVTEFGSYCYIKYYIPSKYWESPQDQRSAEGPFNLVYKEI